MSRSTRETLFVALCWGALFIPLAAVGALIADALVEAAPRLSVTLITGGPSRHPMQAGILPALAGSVALIVVTLILAVPVGVGAALYLEEYGRGRLSALVDLNLQNLAGVPSIIYGVLGLALFVRALGLGHSLVAGAATLALLVLPVVVIHSREALRSVPVEAREAAIALGATRWQVVRRVVLPAALPRILTGVVAGMARALGETAPLLVVGGLAYVSFLPDSLDSPFTSLPVQIFHWVTRPGDAFRPNAAAALVVLLTLTTSLLGVVAYWRQRLREREESP